MHTLLRRRRLRRHQRKWEFFFFYLSYQNEISIIWMQFKFWLCEFSILNINVGAYMAIYFRKRFPMVLFTHILGHPQSGYVAYSIKVLFRRVLFNFEKFIGIFKLINCFIIGIGCYFLHNHNQSTSDVNFRRAFLRFAMCSKICLLTKYFTSFDFFLTNF